MVRQAEPDPRSRRAGAAPGCDSGAKQVPRRRGGGTVP
jgi:hypothetical protein